MNSEHLKVRIADLKRQHRAIILAHNYQPPAIQDIADICGDSFELAQSVTRLEAEVIVFCGVRFMAETVAVLAPDKWVLLPVPEAGCALADTITAESLRRECPDKTFIPASRRMVCPDMKRTTLKSVAESLASQRHVVTVPSPMRERARDALRRMMAIVSRSAGAPHKR